MVIPKTANGNGGLILKSDIIPPVARGVFLTANLTHEESPSQPKQNLTVP